MPKSGSYFYPGVDGVNYHPAPSPLYAAASGVFSGNVYSTLLGPLDVIKYTNYRVTMVNNSVNNLKSGSVEVSQDNVNWEILGSSSFVNLTSSGMASMQFTASSNVMLRVRAWSSGSAGFVTGSLFVTVVANGS